MATARLWTLTLAVLYSLVPSHDLDMVHVKQLTGQFSLQYGADVLGVPWYDRTLMTCIIKCQSTYPQTWATVTYNAISGICTAGGLVQYQAPRSSSSLDDKIYIRDLCDLALGFKLYLYKSEMICLFLSLETMPHQNASEFCKAKGSHLYTAKSTDKMLLLTDLSRTIFNRTIWIGLSDTGTEGTFLWDDNESLDPNWAPQIWQEGSPDNDQQAEDCVQTTRKSSFERLNDVPCYIDLPFICEKHV